MYIKIIKFVNKTYLTNKVTKMSFISKNKILIVPDKFKGSLSAKEVADSISDAISNQCLKEGTAVPEIVLRPMADGGEGSLAAIEAALKGNSRRITVDAVNARGQAMQGEYLMFGDTAFIELANTCGLTLLSEEERDPLLTDTYGFGLVIRHAVERSDARHIVLAIGGSATNDGGVGLLSAIGFFFKTKNSPRNTAQMLANIRTIENFEAVAKIIYSCVKISVACDVTNPLLGPSGATMVYGPQKGGDKKSLKALEKGMANWAKVVQEWSDNRGGAPNLAEIPGTGAAGGVGFALHAVLGGELVPGWKLFSKLMRLEDEIASADLVITGEGSFDSQSLHGKLPWGIAQLCKQHGKPLMVVCGQSHLKEEELKDAEISKVVSLTELHDDKAYCMANAAKIIRGISFLLLLLFTTI